MIRPQALAASEPHELSAVRLRDEIASGRVSAFAAAQAFLARIELRDPQLGAFTVVSSQAALERAERLDAARAAGGPQALAASDPRAAPLWGMPFADKDLVARAGVRTAYGSLAFERYVPHANDPLADRMDQAGGVSLGKTATSELGLTGYARSRIRVSRNPWDPRRDPGGSSGGAAVAVAAGMLPFAPGSDGGGSIRIPAAACGLVGLKPSRGRVPGSGDSLAGLVVAGPIARSAADAALLLDGMVAPDAVTGSRGGFFRAALAEPPRPMRLAWSSWTPWRELFHDIGAGAEEMRVLEETLRLLERLGHRVERAPEPSAAGYAEAFTVAWQSAAAMVQLDEEQLELVEPFTRWLISAGRARRARELAAALLTLAGCEREITAAFAPYDAVLTPALGEASWLLEDFGARGEEGFELQCRLSPFTSYANVAGLPAVSMPAGVRSGGQLPVGVQAIGRPGGEATLLRLAHQLEEQLHWEQRRPPQPVG